MIISITYIQPNITIESELIGLKKFYVYNYKGVHYRVFCSLTSLREFISKEYKTWIFECGTESELEKYLHKSEVNNFVLKIIEKFSQTNKIVLATNSHKDRANMILIYHSVIKFFDYTFYKEDYKSQESNKFEHVLNYLNIDPNLAIVFENDSNEIKKAISSGILDKNIVSL